MTKLYSEMVEQTRPFAPHGVWLQGFIGYALLMISQVFQTAVLIIPILYVMMTSPALMAALQTQYGSFSESMKAAGALLADDRIMIPMLFSTIATIATVFVAGRAIRRRSFVSLGMRRKGALASYLKGLALCLPLLAMSYLPLWTCVKGVQWNGVSAPIVLYFFGFAIQSFSEELLFRGYLMPALIARRGVLFGVIYNAAIFALMHIINPGMNALGLLNILLIGVLLSLMTLYTDDIWMASGVHFVWNFTISCVMGGEVSGLATRALFSFTIEGATWQTGGAFGIEGSAFAVIASTVMIIVVAVMLRAKINRQAAPEPPVYTGGSYGA